MHADGADEPASLFLSSAATTPLGSPCYPAALRAKGERTWQKAALAQSKTQDGQSE